MSNPGLVITEQGIDISQAPDYKKVYDSRWPILEISHEMLVDVVLDIPAGPNLGFRRAILHHGLGFRPALSYTPSDKYDAFGAGYSFGDAGSHSYDIEVDDQDIFITATLLSVDLPLLLTARGYLRVFDYDPRVEFKANPDPAGGDIRKSRFGVKVLKQSSASLRDDEFSRFSLNSRAKALTIHQSGVASVNPDTNQATIKHDLGYFPSYMLFNNNGGPSVTVRQFGDLKQLTFSGVQSIITGSFPYIVFKDPLLEQAK